MFVSPQALPQTPSNFRIGKQLLASLEPRKSVVDEGSAAASQGVNVGLHGRPVVLRDENGRCEQQGQCTRHSPSI